MPNLISIPHSYNYILFGFILLVQCLLWLYAVLGISESETSIGNDSENFNCIYNIKSVTRNVVKLSDLVIYKLGSTINDLLVHKPT